MPCKICHIDLGMSKQPVVLDSGLVALQPDMFRTRVKTIRGGDKSPIFLEVAGSVKREETNQLRVPADHLKQHAASSYYRTGWS